MPTIDPRARARIVELVQAGQRVTAIRRQIRSEGLKASNQMVTDAIKAQKGLTKLTRGRPSPKLVVQGRTQYKRRYEYFAIARLEVVRGGVPGGQFTREIEFGADNLLSAPLIRERARAIIERGFNESVVGPDEEEISEAFDVMDYFIVLYGITITAIVESRSAT